MPFFLFFCNSSYFCFIKLSLCLYVEPVLESMDALMFELDYCIFPMFRFFAFLCSICFGIPPNLAWPLTDTLVTGHGISMLSRAEILCEEGRLNWSRSVLLVVKFELPSVISLSCVVRAPN